MRLVVGLYPSVTKIGTGGCDEFKPWRAQSQTRDPARREPSFRSARLRPNGKRPICSGEHTTAMATDTAAAAEPAWQKGKREMPSQPGASTNRHCGAWAQFDSAMIQWRLGRQRPVWEEKPVGIAERAGLADGQEARAFGFG